MTVYSLFGKMLSLLWQVSDIFGLIFIVTNGQILKNLTIWSHWSPHELKGASYTMRHWTEMWKENDEGTKKDYERERERERDRRDDNMMLTWCYVMEEQTFPLLVCVRWRNFLDWLTACGHQHLTRWQKHLEAFIIIGWSGNMKVQVEDTQWLFHFWRLNVEQVLINWEVNTYIGTVVRAVAFCTRGRSSNQDIVKF